MGLAFVAWVTVTPAARAAEPVRLRVLTWNVWGLPAVSTNLEARMAALPAGDPYLHPGQVLVAHVAQHASGPRVVAVETHRSPM